MTVERREYVIDDLEVRADEEREGPPRLTGHDAVFNQETRIWDFLEVVAPGAFEDSLKKDDVRALWNHNPSDLLGRSSAKTLELEEDDVGLRFDLDTPDTALGRDLATLVGRGDVSEMSFGFRVLEESWDRREDEAGEVHVRTLEKVELVDVSPVTWPAYSGTDVSAREALPERALELRAALEDQENPARREEALVGLQHARKRLELARARARL